MYFKIARNKHSASEDSGILILLLFVKQGFVNAEAKNAISTPETDFISTGWFFDDGIPFFFKALCQRLNQQRFQEIDPFLSHYHALLCNLRS
jgi:hypothetical protein